MNKDNLEEELKPYYEKGDCCSWIVKLRKSNKEKDKEIERLNTEIDYLNKLRDEDAEELKKKDNIINELEKYFAKPNKFIERPERMKILDKLKELKEGNDNE